MRALRRVVKFCFEILWKLLAVPVRIGSAAGAMSMLHLSDEPRSAEDVASEAVQLQRRRAQVGVSPTDRNLARALLRSGDLPPGMSEISREWTPLDPSTSVVVSTLQRLVRREGRLRRRTTTQALLEISRFRSEEAAAEAMAAPPTSTMPDGGALRMVGGGGDVETYAWSRSEGGVGGEMTERVLQLRLRNGTALATSLAQTSRPHAEWESEIRELMRIVGGRLR